MQRVVIALIVVLLMAVSATAQDRTQEAELQPVATVEAPIVDNVTGTENSDVQIVYVEVMPVWVLPTFAGLLALIGLLTFLLYRMGAANTELVSEKTVQGLLKLVLDAAGDIAKRTPTTLDDTFIGIVRGEAVKEPTPPAAGQPG